MRGIRRSRASASECVRVRKNNIAGRMSGGRGIRGGKRERELFIGTQFSILYTYEL